MSWQLTSFLILTAVLCGGVAWYERSRPPSQVVALVAALAALAIAGRIAFAAFPNVKPTTDIVVFAGYALGPAPGFAVGALAALVSNFWFGQGPWTPWQMAGWGMCGLIGAGLALGVRNAGRFTLAAVCGGAGIAYGVLLNFSLMATYGGDLSIERFLTLQARAVPFDAAHAIGNVAFALLAGPAMVRMLVRFRQRFEWRTPAVATVLFALLLPAIVPSAASAADTDRAANWLESVQNTDGGFGSSVGDPSSAAITGWAMLGLEAAGRNPLDVARAGRTPVDFLRESIDEVSSPGDIARTIVALEGAGVNPRSFAGRNLVSALLKRRAANGSYVGWPGTTSFSVVALRVAGADGSLAATLSWLGNVQNGDGGWGDVPDQPSNADVTGSVMQAMPGTEAAERGLSYLRKHQRSSGGFALGSSGGVNSQSTAWAIQGMVAVGADPAAIESGGNSALDYLSARQASDGHYRYSESSDQTPVWVTGQVLVAAAGKSLPLSPPPREEGTTAVSPPTPVTPGGTDSEGVAPPAPAVPGGVEGAPGVPATPPPATGATPVPAPPLEGVAPGGEPEALTPEAEASAPAAPVSASGKPPSPGMPIGIGLTAAALAAAVPWWLGRRFGW
ncbi:MAG TPA: prenyltransferase/squalene oxidase repeat-containing protein [Solirubrobacterales bacterium]|nr:prenyltransferase/squalene oxidase repeat-containing protein [Solirubrobacterales bacterium]